MPRIGRIGPAIAMSRTANVPGKSGTLIGIRFDWDSRDTVVLDVESGTGPNREMQTVRVPRSEADKFKLGQRIKVETKIAGE